jgi:hypothetical protein
LVVFQLFHFTTMALDRLAYCRAIEILWAFSHHSGANQDFLDESDAATVSVAEARLGARSVRGALDDLRQKHNVTVLRFLAVAFRPRPL